MLTRQKRWPKCCVKRG